MTPVSAALLVLTQVVLASGHRHGSDKGSDMVPSSRLTLRHGRMQHGALAVDRKSQGCAKLQNRGSHFTVGIEVGTPGQKFDVVADTGSDALIVPSCLCNQAGYCGKKNRCFTGMNKSSTFGLHQGAHGPMAVRMMFGSGPVEAVVASDVVKVGTVHTNMSDALLLMTDQMLKIEGGFEGILGLGLPKHEPTKVISKEDKKDKKLPLNKMEINNKTSQSIFQRLRHSKDSKPQGAALAVKGFMEHAGESTFSMCFNERTDGVLRFGVPTAKESHGSVGQMHWALGLHGISVGNVSMPALLCTGGNMTKDQKSPCGLIPDSGTTAIMAPKEQLIELYGHLCDKWERCRSNYTALNQAVTGARAAAKDAYSFDPFNIPNASKATVFQALVLDCERWLTNETGLKELPDVNFHVRGAGGTSQQLSLTGWSYIMETQEKEAKVISIDVPGLGKLPVGKKFTGNSKKVCQPAFGVMDYNTKDNGPVWLLGTPVYYQYQVAYNLTSKPPSLSFSKETCGSCDTKVSLSQDGTTMTQPRLVKGPWRMPNLDTTAPL